MREVAITGPEGSNLDSAGSKAGHVSISSMHLYNSRVQTGPSCCFLGLLVRYFHPWCTASRPPVQCYQRPWTGARTPCSLFSLLRSWFTAAFGPGPARSTQGQPPHHMQPCNVELQRSIFKPKPVSGLTAINVRADSYRLRAPAHSNGYFLAVLQSPICL